MDPLGGLDEEDGAISAHGHDLAHHAQGLGNDLADADGLDGRRLAAQGAGVDDAPAVGHEAGGGREPRPGREGGPLGLARQGLVPVQEEAQGDQHQGASHQSGQERLAPGGR